MNPEVLARLNAFMNDNSTESLSDAIGLIGQNLELLQGNELERWMGIRSGLQSDLWAMLGVELTDEDIAALGLKTVNPDDDLLKHDE